MIASLQITIIAKAAIDSKMGIDKQVKINPI